MMASHGRQTRRGLTVVALVLALAMAALEATVVATAMPTVTGDLGGIEYYSWVTTAFMMLSAITVPISGKMADLYGRKPVLLFGMTVFLLGSAASSAAVSMPMLIACRALQGLGAGAMQSMPLTILGDIFGVEERAKMQGFFGAVWGFFGLVGPLIGGVIVEHVSWRWVFYMNVPFGVAGAALLVSSFHENVSREKKPHLDIVGAAIFASLVSLVLFAAGGHHESGHLLLGVVVLLLGIFIFVERRAIEPMLPLGLFKSRLIALASVINAAAGGCMFGLLTYVPLYVQGVRHGTPTEAGTSIAPMLVAWPIASAIAGRIVIKVGFRALVRTGIGFTAVATLLLAVFAKEGPWALRSAAVLFGIGMGFVNIAIIIAVQTSVSWEYRGVATASTMFFRIIGGTVAVGVMGGVIIAALAMDSTIPKGAASQLLSREGMASIAPEIASRIAGALERGLGTVFWIIGGLSVVAFICALFFPHVRPSNAPSNMPESKT